MQKKAKLRKSLLAALCFVLIAATALSMTGCSSQKPEAPVTPDNIPVSAENIGQGEIKFTFCVTHADGKLTEFIISTDKKTIGEALEENNLLSGEEGPYGLYVKTVDGETLDYETDGLYWAFYQKNELSPVGVDMTEIIPGSTYSFKAQK